MRETRRKGLGAASATFAVVVIVVAGAVGLYAIRTGGAPASTGGPDSSSLPSANGIRLEASVNSTRIEQGQSLNVSLSITNTLSLVNPVSATDSWPFEGIPVALWPACYFPLPVQVVVLKGNFTADQLRSRATYTPNYSCMEGGRVNEISFQPKSDQVSLAGNVCYANCNNEVLGPYRLDFNFTTAGYWDLQALSSELNPPILGALTPGSLLSLPFAPGVYTVGVADEWGQAVVLHVTVIGSSAATSETCTVSSEPTGFFLHLVPDSGTGVIPGLIVQVTPMTECGGGATADTSAEMAYVTNGTGWVVASIPPVSGNFYLVYSFEFSGKEYSINASWQPEQATFTMVGLPSGIVTTTYVIPKSCNTTCTY